MTETQTGEATGQSANGAAPALPPEPPADIGERWLGIVVIVAGLFLVGAGIDRITGGRLTGAFYRDADDASG